MNIENMLNIADFDYALPESRIAQHPVNPRDHAKLLVWQEAQISHHHFFELPKLLPVNSLLVRNQTKVIAARLIFPRKDKKAIEIFLLNPADNIPIEKALINQSNSRWQVLIGGNKSWKANEILSLSLPSLSGKLIAKKEITIDNTHIVVFEWQPANIPFLHIIEAAGTIPLPPYLNRTVVASDYTDYQTVYAQNAGSVAAPTAGLHFTEKLFEALAAAGITTADLTLHVSAGTFLPLKSDQISKHLMHSENISISTQTIEKLCHHQSVIAVGTTSLRTLESLYWYGCELMEKEISSEPLSIDVSQWQWQRYQYNNKQLPNRNLVFNHILDILHKKNQTYLSGKTALMIVPGYPISGCEGIITNFHQPKSTLLLLVAAVVGKNWKTIYQTALAHDYRFLSYGDASLLWKTTN
jgi:S-adenosylmethionine:tRNA ribosyltransferase-isomerase